ncbi:MAG TPA: radical SAM protein [Victivallales bacterium]|nr:radical SAM protein [Victivallales bacterium]
MKTLIISELFLSIQGESTYVGRPCYFIRLAGCNLECSYCDTKYSISNTDSKEYEISELVEKAVESGVKFVEITGGEPLLQKNVQLLSDLLLKEKLTVLIETNGSVAISDLPPGVIKILDCKCPSSGMDNEMFFENFDLLTKNDEVKFVMSNKQDYEYAVNIINSYKLITKTEKILFSPVAGKLSPKLLAEWMVRDKIPAILQLQLQKIIWTNIDRGV